MKIIFYVPGMPFDGNTFHQKSIGGSETMGYYISREMAKRGHEVVCFSHVPDNKRKVVDGVEYVPIGVCDKATPHGREFQYFAENYPSDVIIAQRNPTVFSQNYFSKINLWWTHDLALKRYQGLVMSQAWNIDGMLAVSEFHKNQIHEVYGYKLQNINVLPNAVESSLFSNKKSAKDKLSSKTLLYSSRPERGLENLVGTGRIMDQLYKIDPEIKLAIVSYEYTSPEMAPYYEQLLRRCASMPNVVNYGALNKSDLAKLMLGTWLQVYPSGFEETSCISAMEAQSAGTPFICSPVGALTETLKDGGAIFVDTQDEGSILWGETASSNDQKFIDAILSLSKEELYEPMYLKAIEKSEQFSIEKSAENLELLIEDIFYHKVHKMDRTAHYLINNSEIIRCREYLKNSNFDLGPWYCEYDDILSNKNEHYESVASHHLDNGNIHELGNDQHHLSEKRMQDIINRIKSLQDGSRVLDYGCCVGQFAIAAARAFPYIEFVGVDISQNQVNFGNKYIEENSIRNVKLYQASSPEDCSKLGLFDLVIAAEILEHLEEPVYTIKGLEKLLVIDGFVLCTTPYGPYDCDEPYGAYKGDRVFSREHLWNFSYEDIKTLIGAKKDSFIGYVPFRETPAGRKLGNFSFGWRKSDMPFGELKLELFECSPTETLSVCMICKSDSKTLGKALQSIKGIAAEIIIGIDGDAPNAELAAKEFGAYTFKIESPCEIGFDTARNLTIEKAACDWILWLDDDEILVWPEHIIKYLRNNAIDAYAVPQHHYSVEPAGIMKTDFPCRLFRNYNGIKFFGHVHEHPEKEINKGPGSVCLLDPKDVVICHNGYENENVRKERFKRNWPLMKIDHEKYPERDLGKFLWIRDLTHMILFNGVTSPESLQLAHEALTGFRELIKFRKHQMVIDSLEYITLCSEVIAGPNCYYLETGNLLQYNGLGDQIGNQPLTGVRVKLPTKKDVVELYQYLLDEKMNNFDNKYL